MQYRELSEEEYELFSSNHEQANFLSSIYQYRLKKQQGFEVFLVGVVESNQVIAATMLIRMQMLKKFSYFYAPRGFLVNYHDASLVSFFMNALKEFAKLKRAIYIKFDPYVCYQEHDKNGDVVKDGFHNQECFDNIIREGAIHKGFTTGFQDTSQVRWMMSLNLSNHDALSLLKQMDTLRKRIIKKTEKNNYVKVMELSYSELSRFMRIVESTSHRKGFFNRDLTYYEELYRFYQESHISVPLAYLDIREYKEDLRKQHASEIQKREGLLKGTLNEKMQQKMTACEQSLKKIEERQDEANSLFEKHGDTIDLATGFFINYGNEVLYLAGGSTPEFSKFHGPYAIQWHMIRFALRNGYEKYNFYGTSGDFTKSAEDYGVFEFKRGFHAVAEELMGDFYLPVRPFLWKLCQIGKQIQ